MPKREGLRKASSINVYVRVNKDDDSITKSRFSIVDLAIAAYSWKLRSEGAGQIFHKGRIWYMTPMARPLFCSREKHYKQSVTSAH
jgi:hypothetical protein